jgi:2'-5' RNA ligase
MMHRLFIALRPPAPVRQLLLSTMGSAAGARWQNDEQLHLTLRFIGEVTRPVAEDVATALFGIRFPSFELALNGIGSFERKGRIDQLWAGISPAAEVTMLHHKIDQALIRVGLPAESRAFVPHITLARFNKSGGDIATFAIQHAQLSSPPFPITCFSLYESTISHDGAHYDLVARYPLLTD